MVPHPGQYRWSSYRVNAQGGEDRVPKPHEEYLRLGEDPASRREAYRALFRTCLEPGIVDEIRTALNNELVVGAGRFKGEIEAATGRATRLGRPGRPAKGEQ
jgi:putative transposase